MVIDKTPEEIISSLESAIVTIPQNKIKNTSNINKRNEDFCVFILTYGRANNQKTYETLHRENSNFSQDLYFICSDDDSRLPEMIERFGDRVLVFNKEIAKEYNDTFDNFNKMNIVLYARNMCFTFAKKLGYKYFLELDDDYVLFSQKIPYDETILYENTVYDYDTLFNIHLDFLKNTGSDCVTMSQNGDYIGGAQNGNSINGYQRKVMNSFFCTLDKPFFFHGSINEDVNYYIESGKIGSLNFNLFGFALKQCQTQSNEGGLTDIYLSEGTYVKSFYSVICCPSSTRIGKISSGAGERLHHRVDAELAYPKILDEKYSKFKYNELHNEEW